ncbi:MAG: choice-of-anchor B family protein [Gemmatimonadota bacterium]
MRSVRPFLIGLAAFSLAVPAVAQTRFGQAVAVGDGEVIIGEPASGNAFRPGRVYVYRKVGGVWKETARLSAAQPQRADGFGGTIALSGSNLFVAERDWTAIRVFTKQSGTWRATGSIAPGTIAGPVAAMVASGDWLFLGTPGQAPGGRGGRGGGGGRGGQPQAPPQPGAVLAYKRGANGQWTQQSTLVAADASAGDLFGSALSRAERALLVGAPGARERAGAVYSFQLDGAGNWQPVRTLQAREPQANDAFGSSVAIQGDVVVIGAPGAATNYGAAFVFRRSAAGDWVEDTRLTAFAGGRQERFGGVIEVGGSDIWVSVPNRLIQTGGAQRRPGGVYVFQTVAAGKGIGASRLITPTRLEPDDQFGQALAANATIAAVASPGADHNAGTVTVFERDATGRWRERAELVSEADAMEALTGRERRCSDEGKVGVFACGAAELMSYLPVSKIAIEPRGVRLNDMWGWADAKTGREYALVGRIEGTSFVDVTDPANPIFVGELLKTPGVPDGTWRDIKVYKDHAFIVADGAGAHGMQVFDLAQLRGLTGKPAKRFQPTAHYTRINSSHNIVINEESGFAYAVGASAGGETCGGGLHMIDIREPKNPKFAGCFADTATGRRGTGYTHDAQCVMYKGPDPQYRDREICLGSNETMLSIADVTDKANPKAISRAAYPNPSYTHQGWFTEDHRYFYMDDEGDEIAGSVTKTRTLVWDLIDLDDPKLAHEFMGTSAASDHNLYIKGNLMYQSNYRAGLRIIDISNPLKPVEVGYLDTAPYLEDAPGFSGTWSNYPYFKSGAIGVSSVHEGLFLVKKRPVPVM